MAFSAETYAILYSKIKSITTGIQSVTNKPDGTGLIFTLNDGSTVTLSIPNHSHTNLDTILNKFTLNANGDLLFNGKRLLDEDDLSDTDIEELKKLLQVIIIDTDGKAIINDVKIIVNPNTNKVNANGEDLLYVSDEASGDIDFNNDIIW